MLPKKERLTKKDFSGLRPRVVFRGNFVDIATAPTLIHSRFACVIAKKRISRAVDRNAVKRKIYHSIQETKPKSPLLVIIYPKTSVVSTSYTQIKEEIKQAFATL
jgi:ribonuclease P protein component